ncbi:protein SODIUM POTASSIUM ROOT DEFECTIVE 3-like isoform X1 [Humulus lupulus]|uniref:protein SODIUM POTASSIUM ROOT DEFECTIVE 3-like isoform X1 n=1 Tax=Humulus lupulus TaxID=3486 RepID=UPI002B40157F|nr:protein SODIUM POTASSIUM ROOT DEFECTIVE 3-like isoform X1 [Humulus lupulus]
MKGLGIDIFCASQASTAICLSMDEASSSSSTIQLGGKAIDRHNPIISDTRRGGGGRVLPSVPCSYHPPINPKSYHQLQKTKKSSSNASKTKSTANEQAKKSSHSSKQNDHQKRKSTSTTTTTTTTNSHAKLVDYIKTSSFTPSSSSIQGDVARKSSAKAADLVTPPGSTRYLLSDAAFLDGLTNYDPVLALVPLGNKKTQLTTVKQEEESSSTTKDSSSNHSKPASSDQVVVLRVSLHCRGCEGKVRKHLSRMEGVTSFNIDFAAKKVTVVGDVTPVSVLASISKVKNAQFWTASSVSSVTPANPNPNPTLKQQH